jgi:predicted nucleic acid-binding protein
MSELVVIDSSVWVDFFKGKAECLFVSDLLRLGLVRTNELILTELLPSVRKRNEKRLEGILASVSRIPMDIDWEEIRSFQLRNLRNGYNNINIPDLLIAQNCIQNNIQLISADKHFEALAKFLPLRLYEK